MNAYLWAIIMHVSNLGNLSTKVERVQFYYGWSMFWTGNTWAGADNFTGTFLFLYTYQLIWCFPGIILKSGLFISFISCWTCGRYLAYLDFHLLKVWELFVSIFGVVRLVSKVRQHWAWFDTWMGGYFGIELWCWQPNGLFVTEM